MFYYFITFVISYFVICCYFILWLYNRYLCVLYVVCYIISICCYFTLLLYYFFFICVCCISFVSFASFSRSFFVRATYLRIQGRMQILRFWTEIFKNEVLQRWGGLHSTQNKKCYIEMGLNFWGVLKKCRKRPANFAFRILVPMSMLTFWKEL